MTPNDVVLAAGAGALRRSRPPRRSPVALKTMVPVTSATGDDEDHGNRIAFLFVELPCDEPDSIARLWGRPPARASAGATSEAEQSTPPAAVRATPRPPQVLSRAVAHPLLFNLSLSSIPGPAPRRAICTAAGCANLFRGAAGRAPRAVDRA